MRRSMLGFVLGVILTAIAGFFWLVWVFKDFGPK